MKLTIKVVLCISLLMSTALLTLADGEQDNGSRCSTCMSTEPTDTQTFEVQPVSDTNSEQLNPVSSATETESDFDADIFDALSLWFFRLLL